MATLYWHRQKSLQVRLPLQLKGKVQFLVYTVPVKGTTIGAITDVNGKYSLTVPQNATTLVFSYIGMKKQEVEIGGRTVIDVVMEPDLLGLNEVVVTAFGIKRQAKELGVATAQVSDKQLTQAGVSNVVNGLDC